VKLRRAIRIGLLSLLLGALTTYGVAWWVANTRHPSGRLGWGSFEGRMAGGWAYDMESRPEIIWIEAEGWDPDQTGGMSRWGEPAPSWSLIHRWRPRDVGVPAGVRMNDTIVVLLERAAGWPRLAVVEHSVSTHFQVPVRVRGADWSFRGGATVDWPRWTLAFRPLWPGFAIDCALYGAIWTVPVVGIGYLVRRRRTRAGLCPVCRYDLTGITTGVCPECGTATGSGAAA
jgi:hypothetical protein